MTSLFSSFPRPTGIIIESLGEIVNAFFNPVNESLIKFQAEI